MNDSRGCFCMKDCFSLPLSLSLSLPPSLSCLLAVCRASGASLASSQEVKLKCRAMLPNDERLWHPGMLWAWTKSSEQEKMLAFQLNIFSYISSPFLWCRFFQHQGELFYLIIIFFFFFLLARALALQPWSKSSSWEMGGWMDVVRRRWRTAKGWTEN